MLTQNYERTGRIVFTEANKNPGQMISVLIGVNLGPKAQIDVGLINGRYVFRGATGEHSIASDSSLERFQAHFAGFAENNSRC